MAFDLKQMVEELAEMRAQQIIRESLGDMVGGYRADNPVGPLAPQTRQDTRGGSRSTTGPAPTGARDSRDQNIISAHRGPVAQPDVAVRKRNARPTVEYSPLKAKQSAIDALGTDTTIAKTWNWIVRAKRPVTHWEIVAGTGLKHKTVESTTYQLKAKGLLKPHTIKK